MEFSYLITPFIAWLIAGCTKFAINSIRAKRLAFDLIGYGGMPSNHSSIVCSAASIIYFKAGITEPAFAVAIALAFIVMLDASSLRKQVGKQAEAINQLTSELKARTHSEEQLPQTPLRERIGHSRSELLAGAMTGLFAGWLVWQLETTLYVL